MAHNQHSWGLGAGEAPASPRTMRTLRKIRSHQVMTTSSALIAQTQSARSSATRATDAEDGGSQNATIRTPSRRARSNSDANAREPGLTVPAQLPRRPARKTGSGIGVKRSMLESYLRDGPQAGKTREGLQELKYLVLSSRVDADSDGMVGYRCSVACFLKDFFANSYETA